MKDKLTKSEFINYVQSKLGCSGINCKLYRKEDTKLRVLIDKYYYDIEYYNTHYSYAFYSAYSTFTESFLSFDKVDDSTTCILSDRYQDDIQIDLSCYNKQLGDIFVKTVKHIQFRMNNIAI